MSPSVEEVAQAPPRAPNEALVLDAVLRPHRALSRVAFKLVFGAFAFANLVTALVFLAHGAYPIAGFLGLDVLALAFAFHVNNRAARMHERVRVAPSCVHVEAAPAKGAPRHFIVSPAWARVVNAEKSVRLSAGGKSLPLGGFLSPPERAEFAEALGAAIARARTLSQIRNQGE